MFTFSPAFHVINDVREIERCFVPVGGSFGIGVEDNDCATASRLMQVLTTAGLRSAVLENDYIDADHKTGFSRYYYLHYRDTERRCKRLHFFSVDLTENDIYAMSSTIKSAYLGYMVLRPFPMHKSGRTVLSENVLRQMYPDKVKNELRIATCSAHHVANIAGNAISFLGIPWMQQDGLVAVCASTAIWMANWHMSHLYPTDFRRFTTSQITDLAVRYSLANGRAMPSDGLSVEQMLSSLNAMGYEPLHLVPDNALECHRMVYHYIESGIPVIAILGFPDSEVSHAVILCGHTLNASTPTITTPGSAYTSDFVPHYIAQDDGRGPFRFVEFIDWVSASTRIPKHKDQLADYRGDDVCVALFDEDFDSPDVAFVSALLIPVPLRVTLDGWGAERNAQRFVEDRFPDLPRLIFRTFLQPSNIYKSWWGPQPHGDLNGPPEVGVQIRKHVLPHWVWVTEFADASDIWSSGVVIGQVVQDSSGRGTSPDEALIIFVGPSHLTLFAPSSEAQTSTQPFSRPIKQYRASRHVDMDVAQQTYLDSQHLKDIDESENLGGAPA